MSLLVLFTVVSVLTTGAFLALMAKQGATVARHRGTVPAGFVADVSLADHQKAADYERARLGLRAAGSVVGLVVALAWAWAGYDLLFGAIAGQAPPGLTRGVTFVIAVEAVSTVVGLPLALIGTFGVERRFGFNRTTPGRSWRIG